MIAALELRALSPDDCDHLNLVASRLASGAFDLGGGSWQFRFKPTDGSLPRSAGALCVEFEWGGAFFRVVAPAAIAALIYQHKYPGIDVSAMPAPLGIAMLDLAAREVIECLEHLGGRQVRLTGIGSGSELTARDGEFAFSLELDSEAAGNGIGCWVGVDRFGLPMLSLLARRRAAALGCDPDPSIPARVRLEVGECRMSLAELREVRCQDVVLMDATYVAGDELRIALCPDRRHRLIARIENAALVAETPMEIADMTTDDSLPDEGSPVPLDAIEIRVSFDLGEKTMTVGELSAIQPGQVVALDTPLPRAVCVRANGRLIGHGELVRIDDAVGVRVLTLATQDLPA